MRNQAKQPGWDTVKWSHPEPGEDSKWPLTQQKPFVRLFSALSLSHTHSFIHMPLSLFTHTHLHLLLSVSGCLYHHSPYFAPLCSSSPLSFVSPLRLVCFHLRLFHYTSIPQFLLLRLFIVSISRALFSCSYNTFFFLSLCLLCCPQLPLFSLSIHLPLFSFVPRSLPLPAGVQQGHWNLQPNKDSLRKNAERSPTSCEVHDRPPSFSRKFGSVRLVWLQLRFVI